jgi:hypothetical protein
MDSRAVELHKEAMKLASEAYFAHFQGDVDRSDSLNREAFEREKEAAYLLRDTLDIEPTRSVLCRSAASLAIDCCFHREAEKLIAMGLFGDPPEEIAEELRDLLETVYFERHLRQRGIQLTDNEFQVSLVGSEVGFGYAASEQVTTRVQSIENLIFRTAERKSNTPFRRGNRPRKELRREISPYLSTPRAASYSITFRLGGNQLSLPTMGLPEQVLDDIFCGLELINNSNFEQLRAIIADQDYYQNFVGLIQNIAPDGKKVKMVGFTSQKGENEQKIMLSTPRSQLREIFENGSGESNQEGERVEIKGILKFADSTNINNGVIKIISENGPTYRIQVPLGLMSDVVRPLYESEVVVKGVIRRQKIHLSNIEPAE